MFGWILKSDVDIHRIMGIYARKRVSAKDEEIPEPHSPVPPVTPDV